MRCTTFRSWSPSEATNPGLTDSSQVGGWRGGWHGRGCTNMLSTLDSPATTSFVALFPCGLLVPTATLPLPSPSSPSEHSAIAYYWLLIFFYLVSPKLAYNFMQRVEYHAMDTYAVFVETNKDLLATIPPPKVALNYYLNEDLYMVIGDRGEGPVRGKEMDHHLFFCW